MDRQVIRVLVADDHLVMRRAVRKLLSQRADIQVVGESENGWEALKLVEELNPDILLLDMDMPVMDGIEVARLLQKNKSPVRILVLSGYNDQVYIRLVLEEGVCGYLTKEEAPGKIVEVIRQLARGKWDGAHPPGNLASSPA
ncbi:MAG: response regulator transcription factor [Anaerolineaceae bacterium]|nr:response regulator transcription factor [Anaerolineaceae bacterium]